MRKMISVPLCAFVLIMAGCESPLSYIKSSKPFMTANLKTTYKNQDAGQIYLRRVDSGIQVYGTLTNLPSDSLLNINIYMSGACINRGKVAGGYLNSTSAPLSHSRLSFSSPSVIKVNRQGIAKVDYITTDISHKKYRSNSVYQQAFVVYPIPVDDKDLSLEKTNTRIACGIISQY
ncbi:MAG: superoxide dismutase family protein [Psychrobacter sp.]|uniref:superoxide dismutase family protein n=2 Tax=Psychrobacter TaxID=497 RepID=UPI001787E2BB|nr:MULTISPECIES: superoxide dismutase family protein [unclassified Psychrobacter]MBE0440727.1 superoxide dismutase family protein [Psychrobacter sp. FME13]